MVICLVIIIIIPLAFIIFYTVFEKWFVTINLPVLCFEALNEIYHKNIKVNHSVT